MKKYRGVCLNGGSGLLALAFFFGFNANATAQETSCVNVVTLGGAGSGTVVARDGDTAYILTNRHVVEDDAKQIESRIWIIRKGQRTPATFVKRHDGSDLALISAKIDTPSASIAERDPKEGDVLHHYGRATGPQKGKAAGWTKFATPDGVVLNSDLFTVPGDSGAGVFNVDGQLVAVHYARKGDPKSEDAVAIAVRLEVIREFVKGVGK